MVDGAGSAKVTWISVVVGVLGFGTAVVTNLDKIDKLLSPPAPVTGGQATSPSTYLSWKWTTYPPLARMSPVFISKWNKDCATEGQTQLSSRGFSIYSRNETSVGGGGQFQGGSDVIMAISCRADAGRL